MLSANFKPKTTAEHHAVSLQQHGFLVIIISSGSGTFSGGLLVFRLRQIRNFLLYFDAYW